MNLKQPISNILSISPSKRYSLVDVSYWQDIYSCDSQDPIPLINKISVYDNHKREYIFDGLFSYVELYNSSWVRKAGEEYLLIKKKRMLRSKKLYVDCDNRVVYNKVKN